MKNKPNKSSLLKMSNSLRQFNYNIDFYDNSGNKFPYELEARCVNISYSPGNLILEFLASDSISVFDLTKRVKNIVLNLQDDKGKVIDTISLHTKNIRKLIGLELTAFSGDPVKYIFEFETIDII